MGVTINTMIESSFMEQIDPEMGNDFFHIDELLDFSNEDLELDCGGLEELPSAEIFGVSSSSTLSSSHSHSHSHRTEEDLPGGLSVPCEDMAELEWLSNFVEDSFSAGNMEVDYNKDSQFRTSSPVSVLESSSCSGKTIPLCLETNFPGRARTKRPRPTSFSGRSIPLVLPTYSENDPTPEISDTFLPEFENFAESQSPKKIRKLKKKKLSEDLLLVRKCLHCEIQKTPQWRTGPMGPKTLCNACGVRYKSGRLFPEYRPAASPTFVAAKHSNSHKKVLEMRVKTVKKNVDLERGPGSGRLSEFSMPEPEFLFQSDPVMGYL